MTNEFIQNAVKSLGIQGDLLSQCWELQGMKPWTTNILVYKQFG